jgi:bifunctional non-homologous end joining protein LigD
MVTRMVGGVDSRDVNDRGVMALLKKYPGVQLATLVDKPPEGKQWRHEIKFDGYRLLAFLSDGNVRLRTRNGNDWTSKFPSIAGSIAKLKVRSAVFDLEAAVLDSAGRSSFQDLQRALGEGGDRRTIQAFVFDLLHLNGKDLVDRPLAERQDLLKRMLGGPRAEGTLHYSDHVTGNGAEMMAKSCSLGLEGVVSKLSDAPYRAGRQQSWLKSKCIKRQEFVIIGYTMARNGNRAIGALHLGYREKGAMKYAGKVGTGFGFKDAEELHKRLAKLETGKPPLKNLPRSVLKDARWVKPELLCEVAFTEWTGDGHIRHPSFQGLREDKGPREVTMEKPMPVSRVAPATKETNRVEIQGVSISHPDRVIFKDLGLTKGELAEYYAAVSPWILQDIAGHPITLLRCPEGLSGECFYQRNPGKGLGPEVKPFRWKHKGKPYEYFYIEDERGLIELIQMGSIEIHPWGAPHDHIDYPDRLIFDLDPGDGVPFDALKLAARDLRQRLKDKGLDSFLKCTGGKGIHVRVPLAGKNKWAEVKVFCAEIADAMARDVPAAYVATMAKAKRKGKIFVDYFRNDYTATAIADYSVRARPGAPVAVPLEWSELDGLRAANQFTIKDVVKRLGKRRSASAREPKGQKLPV